MVLDPVKGRGHAIKLNLIPGREKGVRSKIGFPGSRRGTEESKSKISFGRDYPNYNTSIKEEGLSNI